MVARTNFSKKYTLKPEGSAYEEEEMGFQRKGFVAIKMKVSDKKNRVVIYLLK